MSCAHTSLPLSDREEIKQEMIYLGVENYGKPETTFDLNSECRFRYRFSIDGEEKVLRIDNKNDYPVQNILKEGYSFIVTLRGDIVTAASDAEQYLPSFTPAVNAVPGKRTLANFLKTALMPVGTTLYIFGGGWNWQGDGLCLQTRSIGISPTWVRFFEEHDENFTYKNKDNDDTKQDPTTSYFNFGNYNEYYYADLDCSGYLNWILYNTFETESGKKTKCESSTLFAKYLEDCGLGTRTRDVSVPDGTGSFIMKPGDIMSISGHVWISLGTCSDGSVVILHSSPTLSRTGQPGGGVQIDAIGNGERCEAYLLADKYMRSYYPKWYGRYRTYIKKPEDYFILKEDATGHFSWNVSGDNGGLTDPEGIQNMRPEEVLENLFAETRL